MLTASACEVTTAVGSGQWRYFTVCRLPCRLDPSQFTVINTTVADVKMSLVRQQTIIDAPEPRTNRGKVMVVSLMILTIAVQMSMIITTSDNILQDTMSYVETLLQPVVPLYISVYIIFALRAATHGSLHSFTSHFSAVNNRAKFISSLVVVMVYLLVWSQPDKSGLLLMSLLVTIPILSLFLSLGLHRNNMEDQDQISESKYHVAPGLATAFFNGFLEKTVTGFPGCKSFDDARQDYIENNRLEDAEDSVSDKIVILFLESDYYKGTVKDIKAIEKNPEEGHMIVREDLVQGYQANGQPRQGLLNVVRVVTKEGTVTIPCDQSCHKQVKGAQEVINKDRGYFPGENVDIIKAPSSQLGCGQVHEKTLSSVNYVVIAENRPLQALFEMKQEYLLTEEEYQLQYRLYYEV